MPISKADLRRLHEMCDVQALCRYLGKQLSYTSDNCNHTYRHAHAYFTAYSPDVDIDEALSLLHRMGGACDCEVGFNICRLIEGA